MTVPRNIFITGCNRGLGLEFVKQYLAASPAPNKLIVTCRYTLKPIEIKVNFDLWIPYFLWIHRDPASADELQKLAAANSNLHIIKMEAAEFDSFPEVAKQVEAIVGDEGLNLVFHNAAIVPEQAYANESALKQLSEGFKVKETT